MKYIILYLTAFIMLISLGSAAASNKKFTVVIDAGHGGKDVGAADNSAQEKQINLGVALKLGELLKKKGKDYNVVFTRDDDTFISLQGRADKANSAKGDIFVSIHTNSVDASNKNRSSVCGASTYILGTHKDKNNQQVARRENSVMVLEGDYKTTYQGFNPNSDESNIIFELAQKDNMQNSIRLANEVQKGLVATADRKNRGVHQAGFWVLWATSMPSILVELDFICNPESAKFMMSDSGQKKLAEAIFNGIKNYRSQLRTNKVTAQIKSTEQDDSEDADADAVVESKVSRRHVVENVSNREQNTSAKVAQPRRRRSATDRKESANRNIEVAVIDTAPSSQVCKKNNPKESLELLAASDDIDEGIVSADTSSKKTSSTLSVSNNAKKVSSAATSSKPAKNNSKTSSGVHARLDKKATIYKIELFSSEEHLKSNSPKFFGLTPISCIEDGKGSYRYMYGETADINEIRRMLESVKHDIPQAKIVKVRKGGLH